MSGAVRLLLVWAALMALLALTVGAAFLPIGMAKPWVAYAIATAKAILILWFFMEMRRESGLARLAAIAGFVWLAILIMLTATDYLTRRWIM
ncbi:oxidase [Sphingobium sp. C100]|uniref:cytochrome C oxidase subunit IV family protein n=1 Tax=Sphingobium sp. C100 TaxID=1207055 RepID=UPI0003D68D0F|nr:cytochrome C oxidase subunit IV family protein [Sphingobium sp. C100]ETI65748.1 oxidase [Sphingobium sp. C100]